MQVVIVALASVFETQTGPQLEGGNLDSLSIAIPLSDFPQSLTVLYEHDQF